MRQTRQLEDFLLSFLDSYLGHAVARDTLTSETFTPIVYYVEHLQTETSI